MYWDTTDRRNMNEQAQACLRKAAECESAALRATDEQRRLIYLDLANEWRTLAERVDTMDRQPQGGSKAESA